MAIVKAKVEAVVELPVSKYTEKKNSRNFDQIFQIHRKNLLCCPVLVPQIVDGSLPVGVVTAKLSVHTPAVVSVMSKKAKSNLRGKKKNFFFS